MSNLVFVLDTEKRPLLPIHPGKARRLLNAGKAAVFRTDPFTIILKVIVTATPESITLKIDPGSQTKGIALVQGEKVVLGAKVTHPGQSIKTSLKSRRSLRRSRINGHTRFCPARFLNRTRPKGWLAPSLQHRAEKTLTLVKNLLRLAPIGSIVQELVRFDLQQLENPENLGIKYQQGELPGYEVREYLLNKWERQCAYCGVANIALQVEHIYPRAKGGSNRVSNLCLACHSCNQKKGTKNIEQFLAQKRDILKRLLPQAKRPLKEPTAVNSTPGALFNRLKKTGLPVVTGSGGLTKFNRTRLELPKTHWLDAACVGQIESLEVLTNKPLLIKARGHPTRQICRTDKFGFPTRYVPRNNCVKGFQTGDIVKAVVTAGKKIAKYRGRVA